jgi:hypothetical protein
VHGQHTQEILQWLDFDLQQQRAILGFS